MNKKNPFISLVKCDILQGIVNNWYYYATALVVVFFAMFEYYTSVMNAMEESSFTLMDGLKEFFLGIHDSVDNPEFQFPTVFLSYLIIPFIVVSFYPSNDFLERAKVIFIRTGKKSIWWYSKCIWLMLGVLLYMAFFYLGMFVFVGVFGEISLEFIDGVDGVDMSISDKLLQFVVLPTVTTIALGLMQMVVSVATTPLYGVLVQIAELTLSMLYISPFLPGNYYMYMRSTFFREDGVNFATAMIVCLVISVVSIVAGKLIVEQKDII